MIEIITGNLLDAKEKYICHQCNCVSHMAAGVAKAIFDKFPYSDIYSIRHKGQDMIAHDVPGTNIIKGNGIDQRFVVNMLSQYYPGGSYPHYENDNTKSRQQYFHKCLKSLAKVPDLDSVAFPAGIGCGLAAGDWEWYYGTIKNFASYIEKMQHAKVVIYKLPDSTFQI